MLTLVATDPEPARVDPPETVRELRDVPLFAALDPSVLRAMAEATTVVRIDAGRVLFEQGDDGDSVYVVRSGRVEVRVDGTVVRSHGRGEVFGELALIVDGRRTATVTALRDTELLRLDRAAVEGLLGRDPVVSGLVRWLVRLLPGVESAAPADRTCTVITLLPADGRVDPALVAELADRLTAAMGGPARVARLDDRGRPVWSAGEWTGRLDRAEATHRFVLLVSTLPGDGGAGPRGGDTAQEWARYCARQGDRTLVLADPRAPAPRAHRGAADLVALTRGPATALRAWAAVFDGPVHHVHPALPAADVARLARRVTGRSLGLVLSGGGARGLAHIGLLEVLARDGVQVDRVGGTSMGAVVAALAALGVEADEMVDFARRELVRARPFADLTWPRHSLVRGRRLDRTLARVFGTAQIEDQRRSLFTVSTDLVSGRAAVHRRGPLADAVALSVRLPGILPPRRVGAGVHVDGGVLDNLPVGTMADDGEGPVVASDVAMPFDAGEALPFRRRGLPHIVDVLGRSMTLAAWNHGVKDRDRAHTVVTPDLGAIGMFEFSRVDELVDAGRRAAQAALPAIRSAVTP